MTMGAPQSHPAKNQQGALMVKKLMIPLNYGKSKINSRQRNIHLQRQEYLAGRTHLKSLPSEICFLMGFRCISGCQPCVMGSKEFQANLKEAPNRFTNAEWEELGELKKFLVKAEISGGEPLVYQETMALTKLFSEHPEIIIQYDTNALYIPDALKEFLGVGEKKFFVSIDAVSADTYKYIRGRDLDKVHRNIDFLSKFPKVELLTNFVLQKANWDELLPFIHWAADHGFTLISVQMLTYQGKYMENYFEKNDVLSDSDSIIKSSGVLRRANELATELGMVFFHNLEPEVLHRKIDLGNFQGLPKSRERVMETFCQDDLACFFMWNRIEVSRRVAQSVCFCKNNVIRDDDKGLLIREAWNSPEFVQAREHFVRRNYGGSCKQNCLYTNRLTSGRLLPANHKKKWVDLKGEKIGAALTSLRERLRRSRG